jgi:hypothetical protein
MSKKILPIGIEATGLCSDLNTSLWCRRGDALIIEEAALGILPYRDTVHDYALIGVRRHFY